MESVSGGPMVADDFVEPRADGRTSRTGSLNGGYWNTGSRDGHGVQRPSASYARDGGGGRVVNLPVGDPAFADDDSMARRW